tara:strand:+ start:114 stop:521 length:408 start_codon:yes stop_codon:yes gene_type:complete
MKKRNIFDLIALKERIKSNSYNQEITKLIKEEKKLDKIITQLNELKANQNSGEISAWDFKASSNIQNKVQEQLGIASSRLKELHFSVKKMKKSLSKHELRRKKSIQKSKEKKLTSILQKENKLEEEFSQRKRFII